MNVVKPFVVFALIACGAFNAQAAEIGLAEMVERDVSGKIGTTTTKLNVGDSVQQNQTILTAASSSALLRFLDNTNLSIGPTSSVVLDRFVFDKNPSAKNVIIELTKGGFRFVTGKQDPRNYEIRTPVATIGVRGTTIGFFVEPGRTSVLLKEGGITVCTRSTNSCVTTNRAEDMILITAAGISQPRPRGATEPDFKDWCSDRGASCNLR